MLTYKRFTETRWKITSDAVKIYPYRIFKIYAIKIPIIFHASLWLAVDYRQFDFNTEVVIIGFTSLFVVLCLAFSRTFLEFDNRKYQIRQMIFGLFPMLIIPYDELEEISQIANYKNELTFRLFKVDEPYGAGISASCLYEDPEDANAIAFESEAVTLINGFLNLYNSERDYTLPQIDISSYKYFKKNGSIYEVKNSTRKVIIFSALLSIVTVWICTRDILRPHMDLFLGPLALTSICLYFSVAYSKVSIDINTMTIKKTGHYKTSLLLSSYINVFNISRSLTSSYMSTDIDLFFKDPNTKETERFTLTTMYKSKNIERLLAEMLDIMSKGQ